MSAKGRLLRFLGNFSSNRPVVLSVYGASIGYFVLLILFPATLGILTGLGSLGQVIADSSLMLTALSAVFASVALALSVSVLDVLAGLPLAWLIVRRKGRLLSVLDALVDLPLIIPTVTLGYSVLLFWTSGGPLGFLGLPPLSPGWGLVMLLHFSFSYPVVVRVLVGKMQELGAVYETAARTLGATPFTAARTITVPLLSSGIVASFLLAFARSMSETGATIMVAGTFENGPVFIRHSLDQGVEGPLVFTSIVLMSVSIAIFYAIKAMKVNIRTPFEKADVRLEKKLSRGPVVTLGTILTVGTLLVLVILPALSLSLNFAPVALSGGTLGDIISGAGVWGSFWSGVTLSYSIALIVTLLNVVFSLPMAVLISRRKMGGLTSTVLDSLSSIPIVIPSVALGVSMKLFWSSFAIPEFLLIALSHLSITYPYLVTTLVSALDDIPGYLEETARTLGADSFTSFSTITLPLARYSLLSGAILTFTRSVDETGATLAVSSTLKTVPVLLVDWVKNPFPGSEVAVGIGTTALLLTSIIILLLLKSLSREKRHA